MTDTSVTRDPSDPRLERYLGLLAQWNTAYNLTAIRDPVQMRTQHVADCAAVVEPIRRELSRKADGPPTAGDAKRLLDVGSGGGLPGVILALAEASWDVTCVDAVGKKAAFIRQVASELGLPNLHAEHARVEALKLPPFDLIICRAFAALPEFVEVTRELLAANGVWVAMKGKRPDNELAALAPNVDVFHVEPLTVPGLDAHRCLIWMRPQ